MFPCETRIVSRLTLIEPDPLQPRRFFDEEALKELAASIQARDIMQPLTVRWEPNAQKYRIIDGERRYRAAAIAKLRDVPCLLAEADSRDVLVDQIVHNWQRADLRPYETADALVRLKKEFGMTPAEIAKLTGKSIGEVAKLIALVERVVPEVQERVREHRRSLTDEAAPLHPFPVATGSAETPCRPHRARATHRPGNRAARSRRP